MSLKTLILSSLLILISLHVDAKFISKRKEFIQYDEKSDYVLIASTGRSGSTMLTDQLRKFMPKKGIENPFAATRAKF